MAVAKGGRVLKTSCIPCANNASSVFHILGMPSRKVQEYSKKHSLWTVSTYMKHVCRNWSVNIGLIGATSFLDSLTCTALLGKKGVASQFMSGL